MTRTLLTGTLVLALCAPALSQQAVRSFPMDPVAGSVGFGETFSPDLGQIQLLAELQDLTLTDVPLGDGARADVELSRLSVERRSFGFFVDGAPRPGLLEGLDLTVWKGIVAGDPSSEAILSFSNQGSRGWIVRGGEVVHFIGRPDASGSWVDGEVLVTTETALNERGMALGSFCSLDSPVGPLRETARSTPPPTGKLGGACGLKECTIAMETDWQLNQQFGGLAPMTAYMTTLLTAISDRYEEQIGTVLTFPYMQFYTSSNDPWTTPDQGGSTSAMLDEFLNAWQGNIPMGATLAHFISGASLGGGIAYLDVLCNPSFAFGVSANIDGTVQFPVVQQSGNWDFMVIAHELGHNFAAPHTHDLGIDDCAGGSCISNGTVMSYCHLCSGGTANVTNYFHPVNVATMTSAANGCLPDFSGALYGEEVALLSESAPTTVSAQAVGTPVGSVDLLLRYDNGPFQTVPMVNVGGNVYEADLPVPACDATPEYYYTFVDAGCGVVTDPAGAPGSVYTALVGTSNVVFSDDFELDTGWSPTNLGAGSGDWQRGVPVDDGGWDYDPASDYDGSGSAYLTQNEDGNTDVDDGAVRLTSPTLDMSGSSAAISYAYYLRLTNQDGDDALVLEINTNGGSGAWTEIARHDTNGGLAWRTHFISAADLASAGVTPTANTLVRFTANDADTQSIVEAGIDAFETLTLSCDGGPDDPGSNYCVSDVNSTGGASVISASGSNSILLNDLVFVASNVPAGQNGIFFYGTDQLQVPFGNGTRCVGGAPVFRLPLEAAAAGNTLTHAYDNTSPPFAAGQVFAGQTWNYQAWFRDPAAGGANFDLSDAYSVTFTP